MLTCDLITEIRATGTLNAQHVRYLEGLVFGDGTPSPDHLALLLMIDRLVHRADPSWLPLLGRVSAAGMAYVAGRSVTAAQASLTAAR